MRRSSDAILVLNAGSSSIPLSVFSERAAAKEMTSRGDPQVTVPALPIPSAVHLRTTNPADVLLAAVRETIHRATSASNPTA